ncbi:MAG TPA: hypothetical protein VML19_17645 [Verrucomicrobiae bacterium]|nr:hypothetical protein [Verrucomicrobiae bacterium]
MNCQEFWESNPEMHMEGGGAQHGAGGTDSAQHAAECQSCAAQLRRHQALKGGLRTMAAQLRHLEAPARVEAGLLAAYRTQKRVMTGRARRHWWVPVFSWAATAAALIAVAVLLLNPSQPPSPARRPVPGSVELASAGAPDFDANASAETDDDFIPLPNAENLDPDEEVNVVRMEVPRSTMMAVGLPVSADRVSELVEADVMVGADGVARAIRFVDE